MGFLLRIIRKAKWYQHNGVSWLDEGELQADALGDLITKNNTLSLWKILDDRSNFESIIASLGAKRDHLSVFDYALIEEELVLGLDCRVLQSEGDSPNKHANENWHFDAIELTAANIYGLAKLIAEKAEIDRILDRDVKDLINQEIAKSNLEKSKLKLDLIRALDD